MHRSSWVVVAIGALGVLGCGGPKSEAPVTVAEPAAEAKVAEDPAPQEATAPEAAKASEEEGVALPIPSDPKAKYHVLAIEQGPNGLIYIQSKREGPSGVSFSERQVKCGANTFAYTREGDTLEGLLAEPRKPDPMGARVTGSISDVVSQYACDHPPKG